MEKYNHREIEKKWQKIWGEKNVSKIDKDDTKNKYYVLDMFPYPSGDGLHMGHTESYTASDVFYRFKKMQGFNVLHPQGFDSFGLPAENFALKTGIHPAETTKKNMENYIRQWKSLGLNYDFDEQVVTSDPKYYKWTQWIFSKFYENNFVYQSTQKTNWCSSCQTVIANEQVVGGECERCNTEIIQKEIPGWFFKITDFADDLIEGLDKIDWPEHTKKNQKNWIGKSEGSKIKFPIRLRVVARNGTDVAIQEKDAAKEDVLILHGWEDTSESGWIPGTKKYLENLGHKVFTFDQPNTDKPKFNDWFNFIEDKIKENNLNNFSVIGHSMGGHLALKLAEKYKLNKLVLVSTVGFESPEKYFDPFKEDMSVEEIEIFKNFQDRNLNINLVKENSKKIEFIFGENDIWITKEIRDFYINNFSDIAKIQVLEGRGHLSGDEGVKKIKELENIFDQKSEQSIEVFTTRPDTLFGATYMVLAPEHKLVSELKDQITNWDEVEKYIIQTQNKTELDRMEAKEKTGVRLRGISAINPANKEEIPIFIADYVLASYGTGAIMAVPAHDERDWEFAKKFDISIKQVICGNYPDPICPILENAYTGEGKLVGSGKFDGMSVEQARQKITEFVGGEMTTNYRLRDWSISRQRYWGCPIPIVYSPEGEAKLVPEEHLPWILPTDVDFKPTGVSPLSESKELKERTEKIFGKGWTPEYDTMDTFVDSSWYFLRYPDVYNEKEFVSEARKKWLPVDLYIGGAEHTYMHLLFARFFTKAMNKIGLLNFDEPFLKLRHQGMVLDAQGKKMSKSKGNVVNPDDMVERFGADSVRAYMLFAAPLEDEVIWNEDNIVGIYRFLEKVWRIKFGKRPCLEEARNEVEQRERQGLEENFITSKPSTKIKNLLHKTIKKVSEDIENLRYNTAISSMMILVNEIEKTGEIEKGDYEMLLKILSPFSPHITQELWEQLENESLIQNEKWPEFDKNLAKDDTHTIVLQVNGKVRSEIEITDGLSEEEVKEQALENEIIKKWAGDNEPKKIIYVKNRLVNIVV